MIQLQYLVYIFVNSGAGRANKWRKLYIIIRNRVVFMHQLCKRFHKFSILCYYKFDRNSENYRLDNTPSGKKSRHQIRFSFHFCCITHNKNFVFPIIVCACKKKHWLIFFIYHSISQSYSDIDKCQLKLFFVDNVCIVTKKWKANKLSFRLLILSVFFSSFKICDNKNFLFAIFLYENK
jgi:hypothetical protein